MTKNLLILLLAAGQNQAFVPRTAVFVGNTLATRQGFSLLQSSSSVSSAFAPPTTTTLTLPEPNGANTAVIGPAHVLIYDTTLRDGTQGERVSATADDKLKICRRLAAFGVDYIEAGWPGSNPKDAEFFRRAATELTAMERAKLTAFGSTARKHTAAADDTQVQALVQSQAPTVCIVAKSNSWQVTEILKAELPENLRMITDTVGHLRLAGRSVMVDLEHFFDGYAADPAYAMACCEAAASAGASCLVLCDTNGGTMPWTVGQVAKEVVDHFQGQVTVGIRTYSITRLYSKSTHTICASPPHVEGTATLCICLQIATMTVEWLLRTRYLPATMGLD
jgi:2-isopropylmalate synthase